MNPFSSSDRDLIDYEMIVKLFKNYEVCTVNFLVVIQKRSLDDSTRAKHIRFIIHAVRKLHDLRHHDHCDNLVVMLI